MSDYVPESDSASFGSPFDIPSFRKRAEETGQPVNETGNATLNETNATEELIQGFVRKTNLTREIVVEFINYYGAEELEKILNRSRSSGRQLTHT